MKNTQRAGWVRVYPTFVIIALIALFLASASASAAVIAPDAGERYHLEQGQVIDDDLYVSAGEVIIDGTVNGDLVAFAGYVEVNGVVTGDVLAAGAGVVINGVVEDDVRAAGAGVEINGTVGSDLVAAAGGGQGFSFPFNLGARSITQGLRVTQSATVGKDALLAGGSVTMDGTVGRDLYVGAGELVFAGTVNGDAWLYAGNLSVSDAATVEGTLHYSTNTAVNIPASVASQVNEIPTAAGTEQPAPSTFSTIGNWLFGTALLLVGFALLGWLLMRFAPGWLTTPAEAVSAKPVQAFIIGLVVFLLALPLTALLVAVIAIFFGIFPAGFATLFFLFGVLALLWVFSPMVPGLWIGRAISGGRWSNVLALLLGVVIIALAARLIAWVPCTGAAVAFLIYLVCFSFTVGGFYLSRQQRVSGGMESALGGEMEPLR